jgi:hypothetical protein
MARVENGCQARSFTRPAQATEQPAAIAAIESVTVCEKGPFDEFDK